MPRYVRLHTDPVRNRTAVLAPERVVLPGDIALEILRLCDGRRTISDIVGALIKHYDAPWEIIESDVIEFVQAWADLRLLRV